MSTREPVHELNEFFALEYPAYVISKPKQAKIVLCECGNKHYDIDECMDCREEDEYYE